MAFGFTDPALEIAQFARWFRTFPPANGNVPLFDRISDVSGVSLNDPNFYELLSSVTNRLQKLRKIIADEERDGNLDGKDAVNLKSAVSNLTNMMSPTILASAWQNAVSQNLKDGDIVALMSFSNQIQERYPFRLVPQAEMADVIQRIGDKIVEISDDKNLEQWVKQIVCDGLVKLSWSIKYLIFFGHENVLEQIMLLHSKVSSVYSKEDDAAKKSTLYSALVFIGTVATAFAAPDAAYNASKDYIKFLNYATSTQHERMITHAGGQHEHHQHHEHPTKHDHK